MHLNLPVFMVGYLMLSAMITGLVWMMTRRVAQPVHTDASLPPAPSCWTPGSTLSEMALNQNRDCRHGSMYIIDSRACICLVLMTTTPFLTSDIGFNRFTARERCTLITIFMKFPYSVGFLSTCLAFHRSCSTRLHSLGVCDELIFCFIPCWAAPTSLSTCPHARDRVSSARFRGLSLPLFVYGTTCAEHGQASSMPDHSTLQVGANLLHSSAVLYPSTSSRWSETGTSNGSLPFLLEYFAFIALKTHLKREICKAPIRQRAPFPFKSPGWRPVTRDLQSGRTNATAMRALKAHQLRKFCLISSTMIHAVWIACV